MKNLPEGLEEYRGNFTPAESFVMLEQAFEIYRSILPAPSEAKKAWLRSTEYDDVFTGLIVEHIHSDQKHRPRAWLVAGIHMGDSEQPEIELITDLNDVIDLEQVVDQYNSSEITGANTAISDLAYFTLLKALNRNFRGAAQLVWGITDRKIPIGDLGNIDPQSLVQKTEELIKD